MLNENEQRQPVRVHFTPGEGHLVVQLDKLDYGFADQQVQYQGKVFQPKSELHITVLSGEAAEAVYAFLRKQPDNISRMDELFNQANWKYTKLDEYYHIVDRPGVETIIQMVDILGSNRFFQDLSSLLRHGVVLPPLHVTLYTHGTEEGIGIPTKAEFDRLVRARLNPADFLPPSAVQGAV